MMAGTRSGEELSVRKGLLGGFFATMEIHTAFTQLVLILEYLHIMLPA